MKIKNLVMSLVLLSAWGMPLAYAVDTGPEGRDIGVGVILGEPTGFTGKFWVAPARAFDVGLAFSFDNFVLIYADYLFHFPHGFGDSSEFVNELNPYIGFGGELFLSDSGRNNDRYYSHTPSTSAGFGIRIPLGVEWLIPRAPLGIFAELVPGIGLAPSTFGFFQGGAGIRFYF